MGSDESFQRYLSLEELVSRNGVDSFMENLSIKDEIVRLCNEVLEMNPCKRENEYNLCSPVFKDRIGAIVDDLGEKIQLPDRIHRCSASL